MSPTRVGLPYRDAPGGTVTAHLVGTPALLVDPGVDHPDLDAAVTERAVDHVAVTHAHPDHAGAVARYADDATVWAHAGHEERFREATGVDPDRTFRDGDAVGPATVLATPGHAPDHVAFLAEGAALCGDLAVAEGSVAVAAPDGDVRAYLRSLRRLRLRDTDRLYPGHGPPIADPRATLDRLYRHRLDRERRVLTAVRDGATDPDAVVEAAYDADLAGVRDLARRTVVAHLEKLVSEGKVAWDPTTGRVEPA